MPVLIEALENLKAKLDEGDMGSIEKAVGSFDQMGFPAQSRTLIAAIKSLVDEYNYFDAADKTEEALKLLGA